MLAIADFNIAPPPATYAFAKAMADAPRRICGRYAPSPTGPLHLGNLQTALLSWLHARLQNATFILRMEDLDTPRMRPNAHNLILEDLQWLGLDWDEGPDKGGAFGPYTQSQRQEIYTAALASLYDKGQVFACLCSRKDLAEAASAPHGPMPGVYPGTCRLLTSQQLLKRQQQKQNKPFAWRLHVPAACHIRFQDQLQGPHQEQLEKEVGDFILRRADALFAYQLAVVVDDALMGVSDVVRAIDLRDSTARQIYLFQCFDKPEPRFWHVPLLMDPATGKRLSKRDGSESVAALREKGLSASDIVGQLAYLLGFQERSEACSAQELLAGLTLERFMQVLRDKQHLVYHG